MKTADRNPLLSDSPNPLSHPDHGARSFGNADSPPKAGARLTRLPLEPSDSADQGSFESAQIIDLSRLDSPDMTASGSFDLRGTIWGTSFGKLLQALPLVTLLVDQSLKIVAANRMCERLSPDYQKAIGSAFAGLFSDVSEAASAQEAVSSIFTTSRQSVLNATIRISQTSMWGRLTLRPIRLQDEKLAMVIVEDLTSERRQILIEQKHNKLLATEVDKRCKVERDLLESEKRYRQVVEAADDAIYTAATDGRFTYLNPVVSKWTGYTREELIGRHYLMLIHPDHRENVRKCYIGQFTRRTPQTYYEFPIVTKDGETMWVGQNVQLLTPYEKVTGFQAIARNITDRKNAEDRLRASLEEKEVLMREIHHRVKNNLQVISALLTLQADHVGEPKTIEVLAGANAKIRAMALVHEKLCESNNMAQIRMDEYLSDLVCELPGFNEQTDSKITLSILVDEIYFAPDTAIPIGMIVAELLTNSIRHAFPDNRRGVVYVSLKSADQDGFELLIGDNGVGMPGAADIKNGRSLGLDLVTAFAQKLRGEVRLDTSNGTEFSIKFKRTRV
jgi:PAS domain S-box-containing protein